jgi:hypothetical protein
MVQLHLSLGLQLLGLVEEEVRLFKLEHQVQAEQEEEVMEIRIVLVVLHQVQLILVVVEELVRLPLEVMVVRVSLSYATSPQTLVRVLVAPSPLTAHILFIHLPPVELGQRLLQHQQQVTSYS